MKSKSFFLVALQSLLAFACFAQFNTNDAYIVSYNQETEILLKDTVPYTKVKTSIVFKFNSEKAIATFHNYSVSYSHFDELKELEVYTRNPDANGRMKTLRIDKFEESNAASRGVFYDDRVEVAFNFLGLVVGSEAHVEYTVITNEMHYTDAMVYRSFLPIQNQLYTLQVPQNISLKFISKNMPENLVKYSVSDKKGITTHQWEANNVDEEKPPQSAPSRLWYTPHILYKIEDITVKGKTITYSKTPQDLFNWYKQHIEGLRKTPTDKLQVLADSICKNYTSDIQKTEAIFKWVQKNIRYVAFEAGMEGLIPREADAVCTKRYGDCKDMANLIKTLLQAAKINAHLASIGSRSIPYTYSEVPLKNTDNHMICAVKINGAYMFLDATDSYCPFGLPANHIQGKQALIYTSDNTFDLETVPVIPAQTNSVNFNYVMSLAENNALNVKLDAKYNGLHCSNMANKLQYLTEKEMEDFAKGTIKIGSNNALLTKFNIPKVADVSTALFKYEYSIPQHVKEVGKEKIVNLFMYKNYIGDAVNEPNRIIPVDRGDNVLDSTVYVLQIPQNYIASYVPENIVFDNKKFGCKIEYVKTNTSVTCTSVTYTNLPNLMLEPTDFTAWNKFIKTLATAYKESVILEKTN